MGQCGACVDSTLTWIGNNKTITFLGLCVFALVISTWTLAAINAELKDEMSRMDTTTPNPVTNPTTTEESTLATELTETASTDQPLITSEIPNGNNLRLDPTILPLSYDLFIHPDLTPGNETGTFSGAVTIELDILEPAQEIILHSHELNIENVTFTSLSQPDIRILNYELVPSSEILKVLLNDVIEPGTGYYLDIKFNGIMRGKIVGLYRSTYKDEAGNDRYIATSKFEPTFARQSFPCFDEPSMKAIFNITLIRPAGDGYSALSNMNQIAEEPYGNGLVKVKFAESVPMSTYLTVFIVSDFEFINETITPEIGEPFELRTFATPAQVSKLDFALETSKNVIEYYINYFKIPYPLPKLDLAAIPDFVSGAMETWGLVTYRETNLLYDRNVSSSANKQRIAAVIAHELAHMWFGNLVTMKWWNDLWLNEGFASYIEFKGIKAAHPKWKMMDQFTVDTMHSILTLDATLGSHPIVVGVETPDQITEIFDGITYNKGASIIRMIEDFIGEDNFQAGVTAYLKANEFSNADSNDLLKHLEGKISEDVNAIVNTWIRQKGLPVVSVEKVNNNFRLTQKRFLIDPDSEDKETVASEFHYKWSIPITYTTNSEPIDVKREWFHHTMNELTISVPNDIEWIKFNKDQVGYYRVKYEQSMWESLNAALESDINTMSVLDRAHLLNDVFSLAEAQQVAYDTALTMTKYLKKEESFVPWDVAVSKLKSIRNLLYYTPIYPQFKSYVVELIDEVYTKVDWNVNPDEHLENLFRITILDLACSMDHPACLKKVGDMFLNWINGEDRDTDRPTADLRSLIYSYGMKSVGTETEWNSMFELFASEQDATEKVKLQAALTAIREPWILRKLIDLASADEKYVRKQDYFSLMGSISGNRVGESIVWNYVRDEWTTISTRFGLNERNLGRMIPTITSKFVTESRLKEMKRFFDDYPEAGAGANARIQALETVENNIKWLSRNQKSIGEWLNQQ